MLEGHIYTDGPITKEYPANLKEQIAGLDPGVTQITHHISSPGGDCYAAYKGYHELLNIGKPIDAIIEGEAQSMATFLALASQVTIMNPSTWMIHEPFFPEGAGGTIDDLESSKTELVQIRDAMARAYAEKTKKPVEEIMALMKKTTRLDATGAKNMGFVDEVRTPVRALGAEMIINEFKNLEEKVMNLFKKRAAAAGPTALDLPLKDGKVLVVDTENGDLVSKSATIDGVAANGTYDLADGRQIVVTGGIVAEVKTAAVPQETAEQKLQKQMQAMQAIQDQLASMKAAEQAKINAEEAAKIAAEQKTKAEEAAAALEAKTKEAEALAAKVAELEVNQQEAQQNQQKV